MKRILLILTIICIIGSLIWLAIEPGMEPMISTISFIIGLIALIYADNNSSTMKQKGGRNSTNYQSSRDININSEK